METLGNLIDKLTIVNIRIWMAEDIKRDLSTDDAAVAKATRITNAANQHRTDLIQEIDQTINSLISTGNVQKLYNQGSSKMYGKR